MHIKRWAKRVFTKKNVTEFISYSVLQFPARRWHRIKKSWKLHGPADRCEGCMTRWQIFRYWLIHDMLFECLGWTLIIFVVLPIGCFFEWKTRRQLVEGKIYRVGGEKFAIPFLKDEADKYPFKIESEPCSLHDTRTGKTSLGQYRYINSGDILVLIRAQEGELGTFEDEGEWIFLHPEGCLVSLDWDSHRLLLWSLKRLRKPKKTKKLKSPS